MQRRGSKRGRRRPASSLLRWWRLGRRGLRLKIKRQFHKPQVITLSPLGPLEDAPCGGFIPFRKGHARSINGPRNPLGLRAPGSAAQFPQALGVLWLQPHGDRHAGHCPTLSAGSCPCASSGWFRCHGLGVRSFKSRHHAYSPNCAMQEISSHWSYDMMIPSPSFRWTTSVPTGGRCGSSCFVPQVGHFHCFFIVCSGRRLRGRRRCGLCQPRCPR